MACTCQIPITWHKFLLQIELKKQKIFFFSQIDTRPTKN